MPYMFIWILSALYIYEFLWNVHIYIFIQAYMAIQVLRVGDKGEGCVKNLKKWVMSFMDGPYVNSKRYM